MLAFTIVKSFYLVHLYLKSKYSQHYILFSPKNVFHCHCHLRKKWLAHFTFLGPLKFLNNQQEKCQKRKRKKNDDIIKLDNKHIKKGFITKFFKKYKFWSKDFLKWLFQVQNVELTSQLKLFWSHINTQKSYLAFPIYVL